MPSFMGQKRIIDARVAVIAAAWLLHGEYIVDVLIPADNGTANNFKVIPTGTPLGKITSGDDSGKHRPCTKAPLTETSSSSTTVTIGTDAVKLFRPGDNLDLIEDADGTDIQADVNVVSIDGAAGTMVLDTAVSGTAGDYLRGRDGSQTAVGILETGVDTGTNAKDANGDIIHIDQGARMVVRGVIDQSECVALGALIAADIGGNFTLR